MTKDIKGDPASSLLEVLDKEQNKYFVDHYIEEPFDLSKVMFILTANYIERIPEELRDRLEIIEISSYTEYEKFNICKNYIIPNGIKKHGLENYNIEFTDDAIFKIIRNYTKEAGVRELERKVYSIFRKLIKKIVVEKQETLNIIDEGMVKELLGNEIFIDTVNDLKENVGIVNGMSYTIYGGDILKIEVNFYEGDGKIITTGSLGNVFVESAKIALSYIKSNYKRFNIDYEKLSKSDIHIHVPEGAVKKDGPSAGITITTAIISAFTNLKIGSNISMTGEITLRGDILPVGGLKEKIIGAKKAGIKKIFIPEGNEQEVKSFDKEVTSGIRFIYVNNYLQVFEHLNKKKKIRRQVSVTIKK